MSHLVLLVIGILLAAGPLAGEGPVAAAVMPEAEDGDDGRGSAQLLGIEDIRTMVRMVEMIVMMVKMIVRMVKMIVCCFEK